MQETGDSKILNGGMGQKKQQRLIFLMLVAFTSKFMCNNCPHYY